MIQNIFCSHQNTIVNELVIINSFNKAIFNGSSVIWITAYFLKILTQ